MSRSAILVVLAGALALACTSAAAAAAPEKACLLTAVVNPNASEYTLTGVVSKPIPGLLDELDLNATGYVYLAWPAPAGGACPPALTDANAAALLAGAKLAQPLSAPGVALNPRVIKSSVLSTGTNRTIANFTFTDYEFGLSGNALLGAGAVSVQSRAEASAPLLSTQTVVTSGELNMQTLLGPRTGNLSTIAANTTVGVSALVVPGGAAAAGPTVELSLTNANTDYYISPQTTPGVQSTTAVIYFNGSISAVVENATIAAVDAASLDWNSQPRLTAPVVRGGVDAYPCYVSPYACAVDCPPGAPAPLPVCANADGTTNATAVEAPAGGAGGASAPAPGAAKAGNGAAAASAGGGAAVAALLGAAAMLIA